MPFPPILPPPCGAMETECGKKPPPPRPGPPPIPPMCISRETEFGKKPPPPRPGSPPIPPMCFSRETMIVYSLVCSALPSHFFIETTKLKF